MTTNSIFAILLLVTFAANLLHWRFDKEERWLYFPQQGWPKVTAIGGIIAMLSFVVAHLAGWIAHSTTPLIVFPFTAAQQLYSIWIRQTDRHAKV